MGQVYFLHKKDVHTFTTLERESNHFRDRYLAKSSMSHSRGSMAGQPRFLNFAWWNLHNFAHFDAAQASDPRWPKLHAYDEAKRDRILAALHELFGQQFPDLLAVCEVTREAAKDLV